jgi:hypothetical protein
MSVARYSITIDNESADIGTSGELVVALDVLQGQHDRAVLEQLRPHLADIVGGPGGLYAVLRVLTPDDQVYLLEAIGPRLATIVQNAAALRDILATLAEVRVEETMLQTIGPEGLRRLLGTPEELAEVLEWVYGDCDRALLKLLGPQYLRDLFQCGYDLALALRALERTAQQELLDAIGWKDAVSLVGSRRDLAHLLRALPAQLSQQLLRHLEPSRVRQIVHDERGRRELGKYLEPEEAAYLDLILEERDAE